MALFHTSIAVIGLTEREIISVNVTYMKVCYKPRVLRWKHTTELLTKDSTKSQLQNGLPSEAKSSL